MLFLAQKTNKIGIRRKWISALREEQLDEHKGIVNELIKGKKEHPSKSYQTKNGKILATASPIKKEYN